MLASAFASPGLHSSAQGSFACGHPLQQRKPLRVVSPVPFTIEAAHKKGGGSTKNGRDSNSKRRGVKVYGGQPIRAGGIIVRQLGTKVCSSLPGRYVQLRDIVQKLYHKSLAGHQLTAFLFCSFTLVLELALAMITHCMH